MVGADVSLEMGLGLEGHLEDMIAPEFEGLEGMPQQDHALDRRLHGAGDSLCRADECQHAHPHESNTVQ